MCDLDNTELCNPDDGTCTCISGWQGDDCSLDVDECSDEDMYTCPANSFCENTEGTFRCQCEVGFEKSGYVCIGMHIAVLKSCLYFILLRRKMTTVSYGQFFFVALKLYFYTGCDDFKFGVDCALQCDHCNIANSVSCNSVHGICQCNKVKTHILLIV